MPTDAWHTSSQILSFLAGFGVAIFAEPVRKWLYRPRVKLQFEPSEDFLPVTPEQDTTFGLKQARYLRVKAINVSRPLARSCRAFLVGIEQEVSPGRFERTSYCDSIQLAWAVRGGQAFAALDLPQGVPHFVDVASGRQGLPAFRLHVSSLPFRYEALLEQTTTYRLTLQLVGDDVTPATLRLRFTWRGSWDRFAVEST